MELFTSIACRAALSRPRKTGIASGEANRSTKRHPRACVKGSRSLLLSRQLLKPASVVVFAAGVPSGVSAKVATSTRVSAEMPASTGMAVAETLAAAEILWSVSTTKMGSTRARLLLGGLGKSLAHVIVGRRLTEIAVLKASARSTIGGH